MSTHFEAKYVVKSAVIQDGVTSIGNAAFEYFSELTSVSIPSTVTKIDSYAFNGCDKLQSVTIPSSVKAIGDWAFEKCSGLTDINIQNGVTSIGYAAFSECTSLKSVTIPQSVEAIGGFAFDGDTALENVTLNYGVKTIGGEAFEGCTALKTLTIPESVTSIGLGAVSGCNSLSIVYLYSKSVDRDSVSNIVYFMPEGSTLYAYSSVASYFAGGSVNILYLDASAQSNSLTVPKLKKVKKGKKSFTAQWKKVSGATGYQVQYSLKKNMKSSKKKTVKGESKTKLTVKKLKKGKKYYVRVRAYKTVGGKRIYSKWSSKKTVKTK